jgi:hypothetical protein
MEPARICPQACLYVSKRLSPGQMCKSHDSKSFGRRQRNRSRDSSVLRNDSVKTRLWNELHDLRKQGLADVHSQPPESLSISRSYPSEATSSLNRHQTRNYSLPSTHKAFLRSLGSFNRTVVALVRDLSEPTWGNLPQDEGGQKSRRDFLGTSGSSQR